MNDICLVVDGIEYPAHRLILCASSDVFQVSELLSRCIYNICIMITHEMKPMGRKIN